jgi:hypothetical protein
MKPEDRMAIRTVRPKEAYYIAIGKYLDGRQHWFYSSVGRRQFIGDLMKNNGGAFNPDRLHEIYDELMEQAGLKPLP